MTNPAPSGSDRRVHARGKDGMEIVRYDRAGKWYVEWPRARMVPCRQVSFAEAVDYSREAVETGGQVFYKLPGGSRFDKAVQRG